jgi:hypothetical protein
MLIVALQDDVDNLYAIWNTVTDRFLGVNLGKYEAVGIIMDYKGSCTYEEATGRVEHPQPFSDIAKCIVNGCSDEKDIEKILQSKDDEIRELKHIIDDKLGMWTKDNRYGLSLVELLKALEKAEKYDDIKKWLQTEIKISKQRKNEYGTCFDGVAVGNENRIMLLERHIKFCENILKQME